MKNFKLYMALMFLLLFATALFAGVSWLISWVLHGFVWLFDRLPRWWYYEAMTWNESVQYYLKKKKA